MGASWLVGRSVGSSIVRPHGRAAPRDMAACKDTHWSEPSDPGEAVDTGKGTRLEQPGPEQGARRFRPAGSPGPWAGSPAIGEGELPMTRTPRWLKVRGRSEFREDEVAAAGPGGSSRTEAVDQEQQRRSPTASVARNPWTSSRPRGRANDITLAVANLEFGVRKCRSQTTVAATNAKITYPVAVRDCKDLGKSVEAGTSTAWKPASFPSPISPECRPLEIDLALPATPFASPD